MVEGYSQNTPLLMLDDLSVIPNTGQNAVRSGIYIETYGIKGIGLHPARPDLLYAMTYPDGHLIKYRLSDGTYRIVGRSNQVPYAFYYVSELGDVYYTDIDDSSQILYKYDESEDATTVIQGGLPGAPNGTVGAIAAPLVGLASGMTTGTSTHLSGPSWVHRPTRRC